MAKTIAEMTASEYAAWLRNATPEEIKQVDESAPPKGTIPTRLWRNGVWVPATSDQIEKPQ
jgi:hypothetical protein